MPNTTIKADKVTFYFSADPPALSIMTEDGEALWVEMRDDMQIIALQENTAHYLNKRLRTMLLKERADATKP